MRISPSFSTRMCTICRGSVMMYRIGSRTLERRGLFELAKVEPEHTAAFCLPKVGLETAAHPCLREPAGRQVLGFQAIEHGEHGGCHQFARQLLIGCAGRICQISASPVVQEDGVDEDAAPVQRHRLPKTSKPAILACFCPEPRRSASSDSSVRDEVSSFNRQIRLVALM